MSKSKNKVVASKNKVAARVSGVNSVNAVQSRGLSPTLKISGNGKGKGKEKGKGQEDKGVYLQSLDIQVEVTGSVASTRHTMVFRNKTDRVLEGELTFPLSDGCSVTYYALDINGKMRDAVPVEKARATQVFEEIEQREVDPGLLERVEGNSFRTRIYPIPANGVRTVSIGYEEELPLEGGLLRYRLPLSYSDPIEKFAVKATVWKGGLEPIVPDSEEEIRFDAAGENYVASFTREGYSPSRALAFALPVPADIPQVMMQSAEASYYFLASIAPSLERRKKRWSDELAIIWDVSLSAAQRDLRREFEVLESLFADKGDARVHLYFLNNRFEKISGDGGYNVANGDWGGLMAALEAAVFDGGTDFSQIELSDVAGGEILFFSDGMSSLSDAGFLKDSDLKRPIHCVVSSSKADYSAMRKISGRTKGKLLNVSALSSEKLKSELLYETLQFLGAEHGEAISEVYPGIATPVLGNFSVAGISGAKSAELTLLFGFGGEVEKRVSIKLSAADAVEQGNVYRIWAQKKIAELDLEYEANRADIGELGAQFGIATRNTSLIVLETVYDYIRYGISPPAELQDEYRRAAKGRNGGGVRGGERDMLSVAVLCAEGIKRWWGTDFTPKKPKYPVPDELGAQGGQMDHAVAHTEDIYEDVVYDGDFDRDVVARESSEAVAYLDSPSPVFFSHPGRALGVAGDVMGASIVSPIVGASSVCAPQGPRGERGASQPVIMIKPIKKDNDYLKALTGNVADDYKIYLKLREEYASSPAFYFDMADWFYTHGDKGTALRILTSIADLELENASLYRLLGYRFKEYGEFAMEKFVCKKVITWRPMEPQSYRDYALALDDNGEPQAALDSLYALIKKQYSANICWRSRGIDEVVVTEINRIIAKNAELNTSEVDKRLIVSAPVDIRIVINWNMDNTDIDLHVEDPSGEECYFRHTRTSAGGRISADNTSGYGPEQFLLKNAIKGKYHVYVNYFSDRQFTASGPSTVMAEIFTKYADSETEQRRVVCLQMSKAARERHGGRDRMIEVAEFEF